MTRATCPTCGSKVGVRTGDEGTNHFIPIEDDHQVCEQEIERLRALVAELQEERDAWLLETQRRHQSFWDWVEARLAEKQAEREAALRD